MGDEDEVIVAAAPILTELAQLVDDYLAGKAELHVLQSHVLTHAWDLSCAPRFWLSVREAVLDVDLEGAVRRVLLTEALRRHREARPELPGDVIDVSPPDGVLELEVKPQGKDRVRIRFVVPFEGELVPIDLALPIAGAEDLRGLLDKAIAAARARRS